MTMMFFLLPSSRQTRRTIWSGVSVKGLAFAIGQGLLLVSLPAATFSRSLKAWKLVMMILALPSSFHAFGGKNVPLPVVVLRVVGQKHAQTVTDGDAGGDDQEGVGETGILGVGQFVEGVPGDEHGHDHGLAAAVAILKAMRKVRGWHLRWHARSHFRSRRRHTSWLLR